MQISRTDTVMSQNVRIPTQTYRVRVVDTESKKSEKGNPMTPLTCEIVEPEVINVDGKDTKIAGMKFVLYLVHVPNLMGQQRQSSQAQVFEFMDRLGLSDMMEKDEYNEPIYNTDLHKEYFGGMEFDMVLTSEARVKRERLTPEQKAAGVKLGATIKDGEGKEITDGWQIRANLSDVLPNCRPSRAVDMPFTSNS